METQTIPSQFVEGQEATPASPQATETLDQSSSQPQDTNSAQVENGNNTSSQENQRNASDYETARQIKRLARQMQSMQQAFERSSQQTNPQGSPQSLNRPQVTQEELLKNPLEMIQRMIADQVNGVKSEIPKAFEQHNQQASYDRAVQEGLKLIRTNSLVKADPEGEERIKDILTEVDDDGNSLEKYAESNPRHAAQLALKQYQSMYGQGRKSQSAPSKAQMQTTATAVNAGAGKSTTDQEAAILYRQVLADPNLMSDPQFREKLDALDKKNRMESLLKTS